MTSNQDPEGTRVGDKVRVRTGLHAGTRGIVSGCQDGFTKIDLFDGRTIRVDSDLITNYSLAARRAWASMPKRAGRPRLEEPRKKMVSIRLDIDVWRRLSQAAEFGLIASREEAVNSWLRERLDALSGLPSNENRERIPLEVKRGSK